METNVESLDLAKCYEVINDLIMKAGVVLKERYATGIEFTFKENDIDVVTLADLQIENLLCQGIREHFPNHKFIGEETVSAYRNGEDIKKPILTDEPTWIIDPIDGTMNFVHSFPHSCISVGLVVNKITEIGIVYNPILNQYFAARRGQGAFCNEKPIKVSSIIHLSKALIASEFGTSRDQDKYVVIKDNMKKIVSQCHGVRMLGSAALNMCMVAMGAADAYFEFGIHAWDVCAGELIVREAGGVVIDTAGGKFDLMSRRVLAAATNELAVDLSNLLTQFQPTPRDD